MGNILLTIYTPTYNRVDLISNLYQSLINQTCLDFLWQIIDDGSSDGTNKLVEKWRESAPFEIRYTYKENQGIHTARDMAYRICDTPLILGVDSDDILLPNAVQNLLDHWEKYGGEGYAGIFTPTIYKNGEMVCSQFPSVREATYQDFTYKFKCYGDKSTLLRADIIKKVPDAPVFEREKLVGENYKWIQLPETPFLLLDEPTVVVEYQTNGYSKNARKNSFKNLNGFKANARQHIISSRYLRPKIKGHIGYIIYSLLLKDKKIILSSPKPVVTFFFFPIAYIGYIYYLIRWGKLR